MKFDYREKGIVTSPEEVERQNYRVSGNYYFSLMIKGNTLELCFPVCSQSSLFCFKVRGFLSERNLNGSGWVEILSNENGTEILIPPYARGFYVGKKIRGKLEVEAYSKIFWEIPVTVNTLQTKWSRIPVFYSQFGSSRPAIGFKEVGNGCFIGIGDSPESAVLSGIHLSRIGKGALENSTKEFLRNFRGLSDKMLRDNVFISIFYSNSLCIDSEESCIMASKSPKYYVSGGFWARDFIFWTLPVIERYDKQRAKELVSLLVTKYWRRKGIHALYLDGRILYDGFELDQLAYYFLALKKAVNFGILSPEESVKMADDLLNILALRKHKRYYLYSTDLNSSDDPVTYPYVTFDNVVLWYSLRAFSSEIENAVEDMRFSELSKMVKKDLMRKLVKDGKFCYSSDLEGNYEFYDDPTGSLLLLPYLGFIRRDSTVFRNTVKWITSSDNKFMIRGKVGGLGNRHVKHPWIHWFVSLTLSGIEEPSILTRIPMDSGICCETIDEETGKCVTGLHFPGSSGFFSQALMTVSKKYRVGKA
ncbi:MAG: glycoside hydrolase family 125 protein [Thermoplasmata archaeon]